MIEAPMSACPSALASAPSSLFVRLFPLLMIGLCLGIVLLLPLLAQASTSDTSTGSLPWESPLATLRTSFSGPVAYAISIIGIVVCGAMLIYGGEINEFARRAIMMVLVIALIVLANSVLTSLFSTAATLNVGSTAERSGNGMANVAGLAALLGAAYFNRLRVRAKTGRAALKAGNTA
jgi:type IV secretory pathway VirB2 component (pilin)